MEINLYFNNMNNGEIILILGSNYKSNLLINDIYVKDYLSKVSSDRRIMKVFKMLGIKEKVLDKKFDEITNLEKVLLIMAYQLLIGKNLIINHLDVFLNFKEEVFIKNLLKKLSHEYKIKIIIFTNNISFCFGMVDRIFIVKNKEIIKYLNNDYYNLDLYKYIDMPDIIDFVINNINKGKKLDKYLDISDLIKGIYRIC